jgi:2Fe-2S ferredoxin
MLSVRFISHDGDIREVLVTPGTTLMHAAIDNGIDGILAECGGACSCATCHCYIDDEWLRKLPEPEAMEKEMLECVREPAPNSRLSCQVVLDDTLDGLVARLPKSQC